MNSKNKTFFSLTTPFVLTLIFLIGLCLRLHKLDYQSFWGDEYADILIAQQKHLLSNCLSHIVPPFYIFLLHLWLKIFPLGETTARLLGALIGAISVIPFYFLGKKLFNKNAGLWASFFLSISSIHINYCQEVKYYPLVFLMAILVNLAYLNILEHPKLKSFLLYILYFTIGLYTHYYFGMFFFIHALHLLIHRKTYRSLTLKIFLAQAAIVLLFSPILLYTFLHLKRTAGSTAWITPPTISSVTDTFNVMLGGEKWFLDKFFFLKEGLQFTLYCIFIIVFFFIYLSKRNERPQTNISVSLILIWTIFPPLAFYLFSAILFPIYHTRYVLTAMLGLYLLLGWVIDSISFFITTKKIRFNKIITVLSCIFILSVIAVSLAYTLWGHRLIREMYHGRSLAFLNHIIEGQTLYPLKAYFAKGDRMIHTLVNLSFPFYFLLIFLNQSYVLLNRMMAVTLFILINGISLVFYFHHPVRAQFREAASFVSQQCGANEAIAIQGYSQEVSLFEYYFSKSKLNNQVTKFNNKTTDMNERLYDWIILVRREMPNTTNFKLMRQFSELNIYKKEKNPPFN